MSEEAGQEDSDDPPAWKVRLREIDWRRVGLLTAAISAVIGTLAVSWVLAGPVSTVVYAILFVVGAGLMPGLIGMLGSSSPGVLAKFGWTLGQLALGEGWLVQHGREWRMHPGETVDGQPYVWLDGEWWEVEDTEYQTVLGWQPFGILLDKREGFAEERVERDPAVMQYSVDEGTQSQLNALGVDIPETATDGGRSVSRGGMRQVAKPPRPTEDHPWIVDLKRVWSRGLEAVASTDIIDKVEETKQRNEAVTSGNTRTRTMVGTIVGLVLGVATGYVVMIGF